MTSDPALQGFVQVAEVAQLWQGELIVGRLQASGIDAQIIDQTFHQEPLTNVRAFAVVRVLVPKAQEEQARRLVSEGLELPEDIEPTEDEAGQTMDGVSSHRIQRPWVALLFWLLMVAVGVLAWEFLHRKFD